MKLYKFKPIHGESFLHSLDMVVNEQIYMSTCETMNDPTEGAWTYPAARDNDHLTLIKPLAAIVNSTRFTCFTSDYKNELLWAHYAGGFTGIVFEYDLDENVYDIRAMNYDGKITLNETQIIEIVNKQALPQDHKILLSKAACWHYEKEYRLFSSDNQLYIRAKPSKIIFGMKNLIHNNIFHSITYKYEIPRSYLFHHDNEFNTFDI